MTASLITRPASATHALVGWSGVAAMLLGVTALNFWPPFHQIAYLALIVMGCAAVGVFVPDLLWQRVHRRVLQAPQPGDWRRALTKLVGLIGSVGSIALLYWLFPEYYNGRAFYGNFWRALSVVLPAWAALALPYIYWVDCRLREPQDALWQTGRCMLLQWHGLSARVIGQHLLGWLVKGYFLPLMFTYFCADLNQLLHYDLSQIHGFRGIYDWAYSFLYFIDVSLVSMTYLMSLRLTDTHIRSAEPSVFGWIVALLCYQPLWSLIGQQYLRYDTGRAWDAWLGGLPWLYALWGSAILLSICIYVWATISFGARFSNLTHRGIITNGPYRYSKHPAYLSKNLSWWLISMPFMVTVGWQDSLRRCMLLGLLNVLYYLRAKTEERHLALDPLYVQYAQWIEEHGVLRFLNAIPGLGACARWRPRFGAYESPVTFEPAVGAASEREAALRPRGVHGG